MCGRESRLRSGRAVGQASVAAGHLTREEFGCGVTVVVLGPGATA